MAHLRPLRRLRTVALVALATLLTVAGCATSSNQHSAGMMGGASTTFATMMGGSVPGYHYSQLKCVAPKSLSGNVVTVTLADMGMTQMMGGAAPFGAHMMLRSSRSTVTSGPISLAAENIGWRTHELVILPLAAGATAGQRVAITDDKVSEAGSLGEASASCASGPGEGITAQSTGWITITLTPGRYELVCNLPNHYADGMWTELTVT